MRKSCVVENKNNRSQPAIDPVTAIDDLVRDAATRLEHLLMVANNNIGATERRQLEEAVQALKAAIGQLDLHARETRNPPL